MRVTARRPLAILLAVSVTFTQTAQACSLPHLPQNRTATGYNSHTHRENPRSGGLMTLATKGDIDLTSGSIKAGSLAINGGDFEKQLEQSVKNAFIDTGAAQGANWIGDQYTKGNLDAFTHQLAHAAVGCVAGAAKAHDCSSGAVGAVVGEMAAELFAPPDGTPLTNQQKADTVNFARIMAGVAAAITGNDVNVAAAAGGNAAENNYLNHRPDSIPQMSEAEKYAAAKAACKDGNEACTVKADLERKSLAQDQQVESICNGGGDPIACNAGIHTAIANGSDVHYRQDGTLYLTSPEYQSLAAPEDPGMAALKDYHQQWASVGDAPLMYLTGPVGGAFAVAGGGFQIGQGIGAISDGQYGAGLWDIGMGGMSVAGGYGAAGVWGQPRVTTVAPEVMPGSQTEAATIPEGLAFRTDLPEHLAGPDGFNSGKLNGTHNLDNATSALDSKGIGYSISQTNTPGIYELNYATPKGVAAPPKTVYDPAVYSDQTMLDSAQAAGAQGWQQYLQNPTATQFDVTQGGMNFKVYINKDSYGNPYVGNVHPIK